MLSVLQNAVMRQKDSQPSLVLYQIVSPETMSAAIAHRVLSTMGSAHDEMEKVIGQSLSDELFQERACFLFSVVPTLTVGGVIQCLKMCSGDAKNIQQDSDADGSGEALQRLLGQKDTFEELLASIQHRTSSLEYDAAALQQLSYAATAPLSKHNQG